MRRFNVWVERLLGEDEILSDIRDHWASQGVANSDKYLFMVHEPSQHFVPFSKVALLILLLVLQ